MPNKPRAFGALVLWAFWALIFDYLKTPKISSVRKLNDRPNVCVIVFVGMYSIADTIGWFF